MSFNHEEKDKIDRISDFIDNLNNDKKPSYDENMDEEMEQLFETIRAVKRQKSSYEQQVEASEPIKNMRNKKEKTGNKYKRFSKYVAIASVFLVITFAASMFNLPFGGSDDNIVKAMLKAYENLQSYTGTIEIRSTRDGEVDSLQTIEVKYKKPNKFMAVHQYDGAEYIQVSDGDALYTIDEKEVVIDYANPEKELWRYHIGQMIEEIVHANNIKKIGTDIVVGREATIYQYGIASDDSSHKVWIDNATNLPLKTELILPENRTLINHFTKLVINPNIDDSVFAYQPNENQKVTEINKKSNLTEVKNYWSKDPKEIESISTLLTNQGFTLEEVINFDNDYWYNYVIKYKGKDSEQYIDIYLADRQLTDVFFSESKLGILRNGWVEVNDEAINVFKIYIGKSKLVRWVEDATWDMTIITNTDTANIIDVLEGASNSTFKEATKQDLEQFNVSPAETKPGH